MAELSDIESVLVCLVTQMVYPNGTAASPAVGQPCRVYRGWPVPVSLDADLKAGVVNISVFPLDPEQNLTRYSTEWQQLPAPPIRLTMTVTGQTVTIGGTACCPLNAAVLVNKKVYVHPLQATDTPTSIATALAALISVDTQASSNGPVLTVPGATKLVARVGAVGTLFQEIKRQKKSFRISIWCNDPMVRDAVASAVDPGLSGKTFINLPDGSQGRIRYERTHTDDNSQKVRLFRRDLVYSVEYGTTNLRRGAEVVTETINLSGGLDPDSPPLTTVSI